jgi:hypothetical protein
MIRLPTASCHSENFTDVIGVDRRGDYHRHGNHLTRLARFHVGGVNHEVGPVAFDRTREACTR